jgi:hypothetical protein
MQGISIAPVAQFADDLPYMSDSAEELGNQKYPARG